MANKTMCHKVNPRPLLYLYLRHHKKEIKEKYKVAEIGAFGSYLRGTANRRSDIDVLVEFEPGHKTFDNYMELKFFLEDILGLKVDLVMKSTIRNIDSYKLIVILISWLNFLMRHIKSM